MNDKVAILSEDGQTITIDGVVHPIVPMEAFIAIGQLHNQLAEKEAALAGCVEYRARVKAAVLAANTVNDEDEEAWKAAIEELYKIQQEADNFYASLPDSAKRGAEILRAARELVAAWDALRKNGNSGTYENNELSNLQDAKAKFRQAVRARNK